MVKKRTIGKTHCAWLTAAVATIAALAMYVETQPYQIGSSAALVLAIGAMILRDIIKHITGASKRHTLLGLSNSSECAARLPVADGDTVHAGCEDSTVPRSVGPPWNRARLEVLIGTIVPPLERAPISNLRAVNSFGNVLDTVNVDQQVQITATLTSGQDEDQAFAYIVQIQDANGVTVELAWIHGTLGPAQTSDPALSWIPAAADSYTATAFAWESIDNPKALSPPAEFSVTVI